MVDRVIFVPRIPQAEFFRLLMMADVILDPPFFGGGNTSYEAFAMGLPIVTWPGSFMRGRVTEGCYRQMGFTELVADSLDSYVEIALRLATDAAWRAQVKTEIAARAGVLYEDARVIAELEDFFMRRVRGTSARRPHHAMGAVMSDPIGRDDICQSVCPACGFQIAARFFNGGAQPLATLAWPASEESARAMPRLPVDFVRCVECGHVYNPAFDYAQVPYSDKPNLMFNRGALWSQFLRDTISQMLHQLPAHPVIVEIGHGDGSLLAALAQARPGGRFIGFDPHGATRTEGNLELRAALFDPAEHLAELAPDLVVSRHVLEHLNSPLAFLQRIAFAAARIGREQLAYFEVPCVDRALETGRTVDFYYEHNSQFSTQSFRKMLSRCGATINCIGHGYGGEVI